MNNRIKLVSIISIITCIASLLFNGVVGFVFSIANSIDDSVNKENNVILFDVALIFIILLMVIYFVQMIISVFFLTKRQKKKMILASLILCLASVAINIVLTVLFIGSFIIWVYLLFALIFILLSVRWIIFLIKKNHNDQVKYEKLGGDNEINTK